MGEGEGEGEGAGSISSGPTAPESSSCSSISTERPSAWLGLGVRARG